jgi:DNA-binding protein H-NS
MKKNNFETSSIHELRVFHRAVVAALRAKILAEKRMLEDRLRQLTGQAHVAQKPKRRAYPPVVAKYRNPNQPFQTWAGRGKQPRWLVAELKAGKRLDDFRI